MYRITNGWQLIKASFSVLKQDKELIVFPIVSAIATLILIISFAVPMFLSGVFEYMLSDIPGSNIVGFIFLFLFYFLQYFIVVFSNSALVGAAMIRLGGGDPTVSDGFRAAFEHISGILGFAFVSATVGVALRMISERSGTLGRLVISLIGFAWNIATFLVVPILVIEGVGPIESIKRSASLLKKTWGEQISGNVGIGLIFGLVTLGILAVGIPLSVISFINEIYWLGIALIFLVILVISFISLINGALNGIFIAAVYRYAVTGETGLYFSDTQIKGAFTAKK